MSGQASQPSDRGFRQRVIQATALVAVGLLIGLLVVVAARLFLLVFAGVLLAVLLRGLAVWLSSVTPLGKTSALVIVLLAIAVGVALLASLMGSQVASQVSQLRSSITSALDSAQQQVEYYLRQHELAGPEGAMAQPSTWLQPRQLLSGKQELWPFLAGLFSSALGMLASMLFVVFVGIYLAAEPEVYLRGTLSLLPPGRRDRCREVLDETGHRLRWWLIGRFASMSIIAVASAVGLWLLDVPLPVTLGVLAGLLTFVPNIGPIVAVVPPALLALQQGADRALYVVVLYTALQFVETYGITPLIQRRTVSMPPGLLITVQVFFGVFLGLLGMALATPLAAAALVAIRMLYVHDALGDRTNGTEH